jgi:hypothetical protein
MRMKALILVGCFCMPLSPSLVLAGDTTLLVRSEDFQFAGGWMNLGEYLRPSDVQQTVADAMTAMEVPRGGTYHVWARARDFASYLPRTRRYQVTVNGMPLPEQAGKHGNEGWAWEKMGTVELDAGQHMLGLRAIASRFARCSHLLLTTTDLDPNRRPLSALAEWSVRPRHIAASDPHHLPVPPPLEPGARVTTLATLENDRVRITFRGQPDATGAPQVLRTTALKIGDGSYELPANPADERIFLIYCEKSEPAYQQGRPIWTTHREPATVFVGGQQYTVQWGNDNPYTVGEMHLLIGRAVRRVDAHTVEVDYAADGSVNAQGRWRLLPESEDVQFELTFEAREDGYYSAGVCPVASVPPKQTRFVQLPPLFQFQRLPAQPCLLTDVIMPHAMALTEVVLEEGGPPLCLAVTAEPTVLPQRWPTAKDGVYGFSLLNAQGQVQPSSFAPVLGLEGSFCGAGERRTVRWRILAMPADWTAGLEYVSQRIMNVADYRRPVHASLSQAAVNMIKLMHDADAAGWEDRLKGFYNIEMAETVTQASPLTIVAASLLARDEPLYATRALPTIEYLLTRPSAHWSRPHDNSTPLRVPNRFYGTPLWQGLHELLGRLNPWLLKFALPDGEVFHSQAYNSSPRWSTLLAAYRLNPNPELLEAIRREADAFLEKEVYGRCEEVVPFTRFYNIHFYPYWWDLVALYELTGEGRYLAAAEACAFHTIAGLWSHPVVPDGTVTIHPDGQHAGLDLVWWKDGERYRLGDPRAPGDTPAKEVPAWQVARTGLGLEQPSTYFTAGGRGGGFMRNIMMSVWAPHLLRLYQHTGRDIYRTYARNTIIGRFANYPGYYQVGYSDLMLGPRYPYEGPDVSGIYYHHIPPQLALSIDYLVAQAEQRSAGRIRFPYVMQQGYAWFSNRVYGLEGGEVFGQPAGRLLLDGKAIAVDEKHVDWLAARSHDRAWLILMSQADEPVLPRVTFDTDRLGLIAGAPITVYSPERPEGELRPADAFSELTVPAKGLVAVSFPAAMREDFPKLPPLAEGHVVREASEPWGQLHAMRIRSPFGADSILVFFTHGPAEGGSVMLKVDSRETHLIQENLPFEFSIYPWPIDQPCKLTVETQIGDEQTRRSFDVILPGTPGRCAP